MKSFARIQGGLLVVLLTLFCAVAHAQDGTLSANQKMLVDLPNFKVSVSTVAADAEADGVNVANIKADVLTRLKNARIPVLADTDPSASCALGIAISTVKNGADNYGYSVSVGVSEYVTLQRKTPLSVVATTWEEGSVGTSDAGSVSTMISSAVGNVIDRFVADYTAANPAGTTSGVTPAPTGPHAWPPGTENLQHQFPPGTPWPPPPPPDAPPVPQPRRSSAPAPAANTTIVWVNTQTKVYHLPGSRWFGKTKHGKYLPENIAIQNGYRRSERG